MKVKLEKFKNKFLAEANLESKNSKDKIHRLDLIITQFHNWFLDQEIELIDLKSDHIKQFSSKPKDCRKAPMPSTIQTKEKLLRLYLLWLKRKKLITINLKKMYPEFMYRQQRLPVFGVEFLDLISINMKESTGAIYRRSLRDLHCFLEEKDLSLKTFGKKEWDLWKKGHIKRKLAACSRNQLVFNIRTYLYWAYENNYSKTDPSAYLSKSDFAKMPKYLPRPLSKLVDKELQNKLEKSEHIFLQGMYLMRNTGEKFLKVVDGLT